MAAVLFERIQAALRSRSAACCRHSRTMKKTWPCCLKGRIPLNQKNWDTVCPRPSRAHVSKGWIFCGRVAARYRTARRETFGKVIRIGRLYLGGPARSTSRKAIDDASDRAAFEWSPWTKPHGRRRDPAKKEDGDTVDADGAGSAIENTSINSRRSSARTKANK